MNESSTIKIGRADVTSDLPSHVPGVHQGNWPSGSARTRDGEADTDVTRGDPTRSTGVSPRHHGTIDPRMPKLTPP